MKPIVLIAAALAVPCTLAAQNEPGPNLILSVSAGVMTGTDLWHLPAQQLGAFGGQRDTIAIGRRIGSGITASVSAQYFRTPHLGYAFEVGYFDIGTEGECAPVGTFKSSAPGAEVPNQIACDATNNGKFATSMVAFETGITYRFLPAGTVSPYLRVMGGLAALSGTFVETTPTIYAPQTCQANNFATPDCPYTLLDAKASPTVTWIASLAVGNTFHIAPAYNARLEIRDVITSLPVGTDSGMVNGVATAQTGWKLRHMLNLRLGFDVILERSHRRRY